MTQVSSKRKDEYFKKHKKLQEEHFNSRKKDIDIKNNPQQQPNSLFGEKKSCTVNFPS